MSDPTFEQQLHHDMANMPAGSRISTMFACEVCRRYDIIFHEDARDYDTLQRRPRNWNVWGKHVICNECNNKGEK